MTPRVGWCRSSYSNDVLDADANELDADVAVTRVFDLPWVSVGVGLAVGGAWLRQSFETPGLAPTRNTAAANADILLDVSWDLPYGVYLLAEVAGHVSVFPEQEASDLPKRTTAKLTARTVIGVGKRFSM